MFNKNQKSVSTRMALALVLITGIFGVMPVRASANRVVSNAGYLNEVDTLKLDGNESASFQTDSWDVQLDPERGPSFSPKDLEAFSPLADTTAGNWSALGSNLAGTDGAISMPAPINSSQVDVITVSGTDIYAGGCFENAGGDPTADYIAKWDGTSWSGIGNDGAATPNGALKSCIRAIAIDGANIYVGGYPTVWVNGAPAPQGIYLAKWNGTSWSGMGGVSDQVTTIAISGNNVYVGGFFANAGGIPNTSHIAKWDTLTETWSALGNGVSGGIVEVIKLQGSDLYVGGTFTTVYNGLDLVPEAAYIAKWDGTTWSALGGNGALPGGSINDYVGGMATDGTNLYVAGSFTDVNNNGTILSAADYVAKWDGSNWSALGSNGAGDGAIALPGGTLPIQTKGTHVYVGGHFTNINNNGAILAAGDYIARWDGSNWSALGSDGSGNGPLNHYVYTLGLLGDKLYVGGRFTNVNNNGTVLNTADYIAAYDTCTSGSITVLNTNDSGAGSLRQAIADICSGGTISFDSSLSGQTIVLGSTLTINKSLTIDGSALVSKISMSGNNSVSVMEIGDVIVTLNGLIIKNGHTVDWHIGGGILNSGTLYIMNSTITDNVGVEGGGIRNGGTLTISNSAIMGNSATNGGGVENLGTMTVTNSDFSSNTADFGGGIWDQGDLIDITGSTFFKNIANFSAGGIYSNCEICNVTDSTFSENKAVESGGGIYKNFGTLTITNSTFSDNSAQTGGAIITVGGTTNISGSTFSQNSGGTGGAIRNEQSTVTIENSTLIENSASYGGGGIANISNSVIFISDTIFSGNSAESGGALFTGGDATVTDSLFSGNTATGFGGGTYILSGTLSVTDSSFSNNSAGDGGGIFNFSSSPTLTNVTFTSNSAGSGIGGGLVNYSNSNPILTNVIFKGNSAGSGGGMANTNSGPSLADVTFIDNSASNGGGMYNLGTGIPSLTRTTFSGNAATVNGGGIYNYNNSPALVNVTFSGNSAGSGGGGIYNYIESNPTLTHVTFSGNVAFAGGGIRNEISSPTIVNSIMWGNTGGEITNTAYSTPVVSYSIVQGGYAGTGNLNVNPLIGALANNGGFTQTMAISSGSPAINAGDDTSCTVADQRGVLRPQGGHCDIGAYEFVDLDPSKVSFQEVAIGLNKPVAITHAGDGSGRLFIVERNGRIRILKNGALLATSFLDIQSIVKSTNGEQGLLSLAFHPSYASNGKFYVVYTAPRIGDTVGSVLTLRQYTVSGNPDIADANSGTTILTIDHPAQSNHNGGTIAFGNDGYLYWSTGDGGGGGDLLNNAQNLTKLLGKILRIDVNSGSPYSIPATNPFYSDPNANTKLIWAYGLRNPWRMSFDRVTHDLYIGDVGQGVREEIDFQPATSAGGENYGWRVMEGSLCYDPSSGCDQTGKVLPVAEYDHDPECSVTGGYVYRGSNSLSLAGHYLYGDYCSGRLFSIYNNLPAGWSTPVQLADTPYFISTFGEDESGELYLADYATGKIFKIRYTDPFYTISGNVGVAGATLSYHEGTSKTVIADGSGNYSIVIPYGWSGTITPYKSGYTFMPLKRFYSNVQSDQPAQNYTATSCIGCADVNVLIGGNQVGAYTLVSSQSMRDTYPLDSGPMKVASTNGVPIIAALRDAYSVNGQIESFAQLMGLPQAQLSDTYYFPAYNNVTLSGQLRFANVDTVPTTVTVTIAGTLRGTYDLDPNESARVTYPLDAGPVEVKSSGGTKIIAALRDAYYVNQQLESFVQLMGLPREQLSTTYLFPAYNNVTLSGQLRFANVDTVPTTVSVTIAGTLQDTYDLDPNESVRVTYPLDAGPVEVKSSGAKIIAALRDAYFVNGRLESFAQLMGLPQEQLSDTYLLPAYNNVTLSGQLRFANVDTVPTTVTVTIAGVVRGTYDLDPNESVRVTYPLDTGPVEVKSSGGAQIIVALRDAYYVNNSLVSFVQLMGLPVAGLSDTYWFPAYNNLTLSGQLRFAVP